MKLAKNKKILICISLIMLILVISVIAISKNKFQTKTEISTEISKVNANSTLTETYAEWA